MPVIRIETLINAPVGVCFDLSRSIDMHVASTRHTGERAVAGRTSGLIELNETVSWRARHFFVWQTLTSKITRMDRPVLFVDEMVSGAFKAFKHEHYFIPAEHGQTLMTDIFNFESPLGWLGILANQLFLTRYMEKLLVKRNEIIKTTAESGQNVTDQYLSQTTT
ncbi:SRPBCC family protein [Mucilaginibacter sp. HMF5004]|nr:SRPBCC family protein [Mucilaginibacter rivuli]